MKVQLHIGLIGAALLAVASTAYAATPVAITVLNPSFQLDDASHGNVTPNVTDWTNTGPVNANQVGVHFYSIGTQASGAQFLPNAADTGPLGADGSQGLFDVVSSAVVQTLTSDLSLGTYTLTVAAGSRQNGSPWGGGDIALYAGGVELQSATLIQPALGTFGDTTLTFTAVAGNLELGQPLQIDLQGTGNGTGSTDVDFDNVRLEFTAAPEPPAWTMVAGTGMLLTVGARLRHFLGRV